MKRLILLTLLLLLVPLACAEDTSYKFKQYEKINFTIKCLDDSNNYCDSGTQALISITAPNGSEVVDNASMTYTSTGFKYLVPTGDLGIYRALVISPTAVNTTSEFSYQVTTTGVVQDSILNNSLLIILFLIPTILVIAGVWIRNPYFGFIGGIIFVIAGVYTMIYGFNDFANLYTRAVSIVFLGIGTFFMIVSAYEWALE
jgi:hypothetical protein